MKINASKKGEKRSATTLSHPSWPVGGRKWLNLFQPSRVNKTKPFDLEK
jgi:hypothetical protein